MRHLLCWVGEPLRVDELACVDVELVEDDDTLAVAAFPPSALHLEQVVLEFAVQGPIASQIHDERLLTRP
jgi:hypothetical protein